MLSMLLPQWLQDWCRKLADDLVPFITFFGKVFNPVTALVLGGYETVTWIWAQFTGIKERSGFFYDAYVGFNAYVGDAVFAPFPPAAQQAGAFANGFFPITEILILLALLAALYVMAVIIRIVKSLIPSVAS